MNVISDIVNMDRPCTVTESIIQSCKEVKLMCEGKISKRSWREFKEQMENEMNDED
jgi:hypothetical protein